MEEKPALKWTGERYVPEITGNISLEHLHRYAYASEYVAAKTVLDIASGEGYGSALLAKKATHVYGVDIDTESILHAKKKYKLSNLEFLEGSCTKIPLQDSSVDIVVSFETIEHIIDHDQMMFEIKRVLRPDGILIMSSPDRKEYSEATNQKNPFHLKELNLQEYSELLSKYFSNVSILGQRIIYCSALISLKETIGTLKNYNIERISNHFDVNETLANPLYIIGICSEKKISYLPGGFFEQDINNSESILEYKKLVAYRDEEIEALKRNIESLHNNKPLISLASYLKSFKKK